MASSRGGNKKGPTDTVVVWTRLLRKTHKKYLKEAERAGKRLTEVLRQKLEA